MNFHHPDGQLALFQFSQLTNCQPVSTNQTPPATAIPNLNFFYQRQLSIEQPLTTHQRIDPYNHRFNQCTAVLGTLGNIQQQSTSGYGV